VNTNFLLIKQIIISFTLYILKKISRIRTISPVTSIGIDYKFPEIFNIFRRVRGCTCFPVVCVSKIVINVNEVLGLTIWNAILIVLVLVRWDMGQ